jgi:hypothetical protein
MGGISFARGWRIYQTLSVAVVVAGGGEDCSLVLSSRARTGVG